MTDAPFPIDPVLTGITLAYRNRAYIADAVLPRMAPFPKQEFKYYQWTKPEQFTIPDTRVGRRSAPNEVEFTATAQTGSTEDYGLDDVIPFDDVANARGSLDPVGHATEMLTELVLLDREKRCAGVLFTAANYPAGNKTQLSGDTQWSDVDSDPLVAISNALDVPIMRPNILLLGQATWTSLRRHQKIVQATAQIGGATAGIASRQAVAELFELEEIVVGAGFVNTAKRGQTPTLTRLWGKHAALLYRDPLAQGADGRITFGWTAQYGERVAGQMEDPKVGLRGGVRVRVGESVKEMIVASDLGYFFEDAAA